jgi:hypothetical protein
LVIPKTVNTYRRKVTDTQYVLQFLFTPSLEITFRYLRTRCTHKRS